MTRRTFLRRGTLAAVALPLVPVSAVGQEGRQPASAAPRLYDPRRAGRPRERITDYENDPFIVRVESGLRCTCGCNLDIYTCRTTDFTCGVSPALHREIVAMVEEGKTAEEIVDAFVAEYGEMVLMAPKKEGFNLLGYFVPGAAIAAVGATLVWMLMRRSRMVGQAGEGGQVGPVRVSELSGEDNAKLEAEMRGLEM
ncbi:MAG: cytochrome c-type biogenesis protein CcmH [Gemmatimonadales bacterium]